jgi:glycosyltransferase involved in cell wall biosynthesis
MPTIGLTLQITNVHGWGIYAGHLAAALVRRGVEPLLLSPAAPMLDEADRAALLPALRQYETTLRPYVTAAQAAGRQVSVSCRLLHALGNGFSHDPLFRIGPEDIGSIFFEHAEFAPAALETGRRFARLIAGSAWNAEQLCDVGLEAVVCHQGVDPAVFHPGPGDGRFGRGRFVVFSGGQLSLRKGQDIVVAAFARFARRHPDALLVTAWHSHWPDHIRPLAGSPYLSSLPIVDGGPGMTAWAAAHGIPPQCFRDLGLLPNRAFGDIFRNVDAALFPNRCEGGTNLVAMECLASGVPCLLADNTGQRDLVAAVDCYPLRRQTPVAPALAPGLCLDGWGESAVEEVVETLEQVYTDTAEARRRGAAAATAMRDWAWPLKADRIVDQLL